MKLSQLEILYDLDIKRLNYLERKLQITQKRLIIQSVPKSGATYILLNHLQNYKKEQRLYINFDDIRIDKLTLSNTIDNFIKQNGIKVIALDNFTFDFTIPKCEEIIISTKQKPPILKGFDYTKLYPLDFEEYIAFEKKYTDIEHIFNNYTKTGTFPDICLSNYADRFDRFTNIVKSIAKNEKELMILKEFAPFQSKQIYPYTIFKKIKENIKISKDSFYETVQKLEDKNIVIFLEKYASSGRQKKFYLIDFALKNVLTFEKDFIKRFENIVFLELFKRNYEIYYTDEIDFFLPNTDTAILCIPFIPINLLKNKIAKRKKAFKKLNIKNVHIISLGNEDNFTMDGINYEMIPFWSYIASL